MASIKNPFMENWPQAKMSLEPYIEFNAITTRICGELARQNLKLMNELMQCSADQMQGMSHARDFEAVSSGYTRWCTRIAPQLTEHGQKVMDTMLTAVAEYNKWWEKELQRFSEHTKAGQENIEKVMKQSHQHHDKKS